MFTTPTLAPSARKTIRVSLTTVLLCSLLLSATAPTLQAAPLDSSAAGSLDAISLQELARAHHLTLLAAQRARSHVAAIQSVHVVVLVRQRARVAVAHPLAMSSRLCVSSYRFPAVITQWTTPVSCYSAIYWPNPAQYPARPSYGWCNWWAEVTHPQYSGYTALHLVDHAQPVVGAVVWFNPYVQGASSEGHYAVVEALGPNGWVLISEMNFFWRGGGFARVDYRYIHVGPGVSFRY